MELKRAATAPLKLSVRQEHEVSVRAVPTGSRESSRDAYEERSSVSSNRQLIDRLHRGPTMPAPQD